MGTLREQQCAGWGSQHPRATANQLLFIKEQVSIYYVQYIYILFAKVHTYVCMYVCMYVCLYVCMYACMYVCMYACMCVCVYVCVYAWMYVCMYVCLYVCMSVCMYVCLYVCLYDTQTGLLKVTRNVKLAAPHHKSLSRPLVNSKQKGRPSR